MTDTEEQKRCETELRAIQMYDASIQMKLRSICFQMSPSHLAPEVLIKLRPLFSTTANSRIVEWMRVALPRLGLLSSVSVDKVVCLWSSLLKKSGERQKDSCLLLRKLCYIPWVETETGNEKGVSSETFSTLVTAVKQLTCRRKQAYGIALFAALTAHERTPARLHSIIQLLFVCNLHTRLLGQLTDQNQLPRHLRSQPLDLVLFLDTFVKIYSKTTCRQMTLWSAQVLSTMLLYTRFKVVAEDLDALLSFWEQHPNLYLVERLRDYLRESVKKKLFHKHWTIGQACKFMKIWTLDQTCKIVELSPQTEATLVV